MSLHYFLDGYNVVHQMAGAARLNLEEQRYQLVRLIERKAPQGSERNKVTVVFDGCLDV